MPFMRDGRPVGARFETEDDFIPDFEMEIKPTDDVTLYVESRSYNPHDKSVCIELTFLNPFDEEDEGATDLDSRELAQIEMALEQLIANGWLPINDDDLIRSDGELPKRRESTH